MEVVLLVRECVCIRTCVCESKSIDIDGRCLNCEKKGIMMGRFDRCFVQNCEVGLE